jgi:hypothetical protein
LQELLDLKNELLDPRLHVHWARADILAWYTMEEVFVVRLLGVNLVMFVAFAGRHRFSSGVGIPISPVCASEAAALVGTVLIFSWSWISRRMEFF